MCCDCHNDPDNRELIHERDRLYDEWLREPKHWIKNQLALDSEIADLQIRYANGEIETAQELEERIEEERKWRAGEAV